MKRVASAAVAAALFLGSAGLTPPPPPPPTHAEWVSRFAQPTQKARLDSLRAMLDAHGLKYEVRPFTFNEKAGEGYNVIVTLGEGDRDILLTAHYDAERLPDGKLVDGVVDNAASVVALVKAADVLRAQGLKNHRLRVIFFDQEELGLLGAKAYATSEDGKRVAAVINFDVNAYGDTPFYAIPPRKEDAFLADAVVKGCEAATEICRPFEVYPPSDHIAFWLRYVPATSFSYLPKQEVNDLEAFMLESRKASRNTLPPPRILTLIHTPNDRMAAVDPATVERAAKLAVAVARAADAR